MPQTLAALTAGLLGTLIMALLQLLPAKLGWTRVDMIRAAGTYLTFGEDVSRPVSIAVQG